MRISDWSSDVCSSDLLTACHSVKTWGRRCFRLSRSELLDRAGELLPNGPGAPGDAETKRYRNGDDYENGSNAAGHNGCSCHMHGLNGLAEGGSRLIRFNQGNALFGNNDDISDFNY